MADDRETAIRADRQQIIIGFTYPTKMRRALAISLGRPEGYATLPEIEEFFREAITANAQALIEDHLTPPRKLRVRMRRRS